jgi:hypothetical protein
MISPASVESVVINYGIAFESSEIRHKTRTANIVIFQKTSNLFALIVKLLQ